MSITSSNKYFVCREPLKPIAWDIFATDKPTPVDCVYFRGVFEEMEKRLKQENLIFYLTWSVNTLPSYGRNVVAVVLGDEWCRIPTYYHKVKAVFKCYGINPTLGCNPLIKPSYINVMTLFQFIRNLYVSIPGLLNYQFQKLKTLNSGVKELFIYDIPLGYYNQLSLPIKDINLRESDIFFAGNVFSNAYSMWSLKHVIKSPKNISRSQMIFVLNEIKKKFSQMRIELSVVPNSGFVESEKIEISRYSEKLMNAKICLVPRGNSLETFRFFEAIRYGCIVITEVLPSRWFYDSSPAIKISDWNELEKVLEKLLENNKLIEKIHQDTLSWWRNKCSESAIGIYMAEKLK